MSGVHNNVSIIVYVYRDRFLRTHNIVKPSAYSVASK